MTLIEWLNIKQQNWDALFGMGRLILGSWLFAVLSGGTKRTVESWGDFCKVRLPDLLGAPRGVFVVCFAAALTSVLVVLQLFTTR